VDEFRLEGDFEKQVLEEESQSDPELLERQMEMNLHSSDLINHSIESSLENSQRHEDVKQALELHSNHNEFSFNGPTPLENTVVDQNTPDELEAARPQVSSQKSRGIKGGKTL
jgi:hypothetical protein